jgi:hypothetical protein
MILFCQAPQLQFRVNPPVYTIIQLLLRVVIQSQTVNTAIYYTLAVPTMWEIGGKSLTMRTKFQPPFDYHEPQGQLTCSASGIFLLARWSEVYTVVKIQVEDFWVVTACRVVVQYQNFRCPWCLHLLKCCYPTPTLHGVTAQKTSTWMTSTCFSQHFWT